MKRQESAFFPLPESPAASQPEPLTGDRAPRLCAPAGAGLGAGRTTPAAVAPPPYLEKTRRGIVSKRPRGPSVAGEGSPTGGARPPTVLAAPQVPLQLHPLPLQLLQAPVQVAHLRQEALGGNAGVCLHLQG